MPAITRRRHVIRASRAAIALLVAIPVSACGSAYTKHDFAQRADAVCAGAVGELRALAPPNFGGPAPHVQRAMSAYMTRVVRIVRSEAAQLRALPRPAQNAHQAALLRRYLAALDRSVADYRSLAAAQLRGDGSARATAEAALAADPVGTLAASYGLRSCAAPGATYK
jgi:hypothetical protein